jgi:3-hydroxyacyl-CoA dehydrogenase
MNRIIKKAAVIGSGVMGSRIACHFANIGVQTVLLDIVPITLTDKESQKGLSLTDRNVRNRIAQEALQAAIASSPSPIYRKSFIERITIGNLEDDLHLLKECDWIIEAVTERIEIKQQVFEKVEAHRKPGSLISTNTSGIPISALTSGRSEDFKKHFCGTHFFNPPRYLQLLEIIPSAHTQPEVIEFFKHYGEKYLGKVVVPCNDTPAFIANRIGVYSIQALFHLIGELGLTVEDVDKLTGPVLGRPKSATFRTCDVVGLDTLVHVARGVHEHCPNDESKKVFEIPAFIQHMVDQKWLGDKTKQGFYKKIKNDKGESKILSLNLQTLEYGEQKKSKFATLEATKTIDSLSMRMPMLYNGSDKAGEFYKKAFAGLFAYVSNRIPEISSSIHSIDAAMRAGFGWQMGPFEVWDAIGLAKGADDARKLGHTIATWMEDMLSKGFTSFYRMNEGVEECYNPMTQQYEPLPGAAHISAPSKLAASSQLWTNGACSVRHLGDGILCCSWNTKMNTIGGEVLEGLNKAIDLAERDYRGLVVYNEGDNFSAGANVGMIFMFAAEQEYEELDIAVRYFQKTMMRMRYSSIPVVGAPHNLTLGGGCELNLHVDKVVAHAELYMGLVEFGVGVIPGGGGTKEFALRTSDAYREGDIRLNTFRDRFLTIGQAKVSTSAYEAFDFGYLRPGIDEVVVSRRLQLSRAKEACLQLAEAGYTQPSLRKDITVLGSQALGIVYAGANSMYSGHYISEHDRLISEKLGYVLAGGDLSSPTQVSENYLLDLERKAFLELCAQRKTLERMQSLVTKGKILRN